MVIILTVNLWNYHNHTLLIVMQKRFGFVCQVLNEITEP